VNFSVAATDACDPNVAVNCVPPSGALFPIGSTGVNCGATDFSRHQSTCAFAVNVIRPPPVLTNSVLTPGAFNFSFFTLTGLTYQVEYADALPAPAWTLLTNVAAQQNIFTIRDSIPTNRPRRFYRVK
jgi:hypothetical protein